MAGATLAKKPSVAAPGERRIGRSRRQEPLMLEVAWEVCNQVGGIYTVLRSKAPCMVEEWGSRYCLIGPYNRATASVEFEPSPLVGPIGQAAKTLRDQGVGVHYGRWLVTGRPHVVLLEHTALMSRLHEIKYRFWEDHGISMHADDSVLNDVVAFSEACRLFLMVLAAGEGSRRRLVAHFHEWMAGGTIPMLRQEGWPGTMVFTTHATLLGRFLAMHDDRFYEHLAFYDADKEARKFNISAQHGLEKAAAHGAQVFTTVSDVTAEECRHLLGRSVDLLLPNGLNIQRFAALHEFQNLHQTFKEKIHRFTMGHFFPSYNFDLDKTLYFYTSGRYEYRNKGMDLTIESLARLNYMLQQSGRDLHVVAFIITRRPTRSINVNALQSHVMLEEFRTVVESIKDQIGERLFRAAAVGKIPDLNTLVDEYLRLRMRRAIHAWERNVPPSIVTHDLQDDTNDEVLNQLRSSYLWNQEHDRVKVVYHPDFISSTNPLFGMEYEQFVRGCHLGVFPSYYEPWGYTPLESIALGVPAVTSDLSGFGSYLMQLLPDHEDKGLFVLRRRHTSFDHAAQALAERLYRFTQINRRERIKLRNSVEAFSTHFDWHNLSQRYNEAHKLALDRVG